MSNSWRTLELRWFRPGHPPDEIHAWFLEEFAGLGPQEAEVRTERHLLAHGAEGLSIKLHGARVEIKQRTETLEPVVHDGRPIGSPEMWSKWIWGTSEGAVSAGLESDPWSIEVRKSRRQRRIHLEKPHGHSVPRFDPVGIGFFLELTRVEVGEKNWWTMAFDVQPDLARRPPAVLLHQSVSWALTRFPRSCLGELNSKTCSSYARWLSTLRMQAPGQNGPR